MKKKTLSFLMLALLLIGCDKPNSVASNSIGTPSSSISISVNTEMSYEAREFIDIVNNIRLDADFIYLSNEAYNLYELIDDQTWSTFPEVQEAYYKLVQLEEAYYNYLTASNIANDFIAKVDAIPYFLTLDDEKYIIAAENAYEQLDDAINIIGVEEAHEKLLARRAQFDALYEEFLNEELNLEIKSFLDLVDKLPSIEFLTLSDKASLDNAISAYESLSEKALASDKVVSAKEKLDALQDRYDELIEHPEYADEIVITRFIEEVNNLTTITLDDGAKLLKAKEDYQEMTEASKNFEMVSNAYLKLEKLFDEFFEKYIAFNGSKEDEKEEDPDEMAINNFIQLVNNIPQLNDITFYSSQDIVNAEKAYDNLSIKALNDKDVLLALNKLKDAREKLNTFLENEIPLNINLLYSGDTIPHVVIQANTLFLEVASFYGVANTSSLRDKASMYLYIYKNVSDSNDAYIAKINVSNVLYENSNIINGNSIASSLEEQSAYNKDLVSGNFTFGLQIEDRTGLYKESIMKRSASMSRNPYPFESIYKEEVIEKTIEIHNATEFINIQNNLKGNYVLVNDIDLKGIEWKNLGVFLGTLDGNGHIIKNIEATQSEDASFGLFLEVKANAEVKDLVLEGKVENAATWAGAIAVRNYGLIANCLINLDISGSNIGGVVCENLSGGRIENCVILSKINGTSLDGGIAVGQYGSVTNSYFLGNNVSNGKAIGNSNALSELSKTKEELKNSLTYNSFDKKIWYVVDGYYPMLVRYN